MSGGFADFTSCAEEACEEVGLVGPRPPARGGEMDRVFTGDSPDDEGESKLSATQARCEVDLMRLETEKKGEKQDAIRLSGRDGGKAINGVGTGSTTRWTDDLDAACQVVLEDSQDAHSVGIGDMIGIGEQDCDGRSGEAGDGMKRLEP
ncbi:unnamed protein product, partial [Prorocentrum cordatum]